MSSFFFFSDPTLPTQIAVREDLMQWPTSGEMSSFLKVCFRLKCCFLWCHNKFGLPVKLLFWFWSRLMSGPYFWRVQRSGSLVSLNPALIRNFWIGLPPDTDKIDAVYERKTDSRIIFFIGQ